MRPRLLILGGTAQAAELARRIDGDIGLISSLAGRMITLPDLPGRLRVGGFGGADGLAAYLRDERIGAVIDATHPFARNISAHAEQACQRQRVPLLTLARPPWLRDAADVWIFADDMAAAAALMPTLGTRAFLTIGRMELDAFRQVEQVWCLVRLIDKPERALPKNWQLVLGRPPFSEQDEIRLMQERKIDLLVTKASGGDATFGKIAAARALKIPVLMIKRPRESGAAQASTVDEALTWIADQLLR
ncbi:Precorrin-6A reductase [Rhodospirillaceae bacterium LM-1]|nr:Precorrin-6A reductase [Rhodospirillaceae bacterium LM-1]